MVEHFEAVNGLIHSLIFLGSINMCLTSINVLDFGNILYYLDFNII